MCRGICVQRAEPRKHVFREVFLARQVVEPAGVIGHGERVEFDRRQHRGERLFHTCMTPETHHKIVDNRVNIGAALTPTDNPF